MIMSNLNSFKQVIDELGSSFDSHDFIIGLLRRFPEEYGAYLIKYGKVNTADGGISSCLERNADTLGIRKTGETKSENILRNVSECAAWEKIQ